MKFIVVFAASMKNTKFIIDGLKVANNKYGTLKNNTVFKVYRTPLINILRNPNKYTVSDDYYHHTDYDTAESAFSMACRHVTETSKDPIIIPVTKKYFKTDIQHWLNRVFRYRAPFDTLTDKGSIDADENA